MSDAPKRIWLDWPAANKGDPVYDEPPERDTQPGQTEYILATPEALSDHPAVKALVAEAEARVLEGLLTDSNVQFAMGQRICCDGRECGCMGADVGSYIQHLADGYRAEAAAIRGETT